MKSFTTLILVAVLTSASAQPDLQYQNAGLPGSFYDLYVVTSMGSIDLSPDGADVTWDLTSGQIDLAAECVFTSPAGTPYEADYPTANLARIYFSTGGTFYNYYEVGPTGWDILVRGAGGGGQIVYSDPSRLIPFPFAFGDQFTDAYTENGTPFSVDVSCSGYGTLLLITGEVSNVVKVSRSNGELAFYRSDPVEPVLTVNSNGGITIWERNTIGMSERDPRIAIRAFPNPASTYVRIEGVAPGSPMELIDALGRAVMRASVPGPSASLDVSGLPAGPYRIVVRTGGGIATSGLIVE